MLKETWMKKEDYVEEIFFSTNMKEVGQSNIFLMQPLTIAPSSIPSATPSLVEHICIIPLVDKVYSKEEEDVTMISEISTPTVSRRSTRTTSSTLAPVKEEKEQDQIEEISPKRFKRIIEMATGLGPRKKPKVMMTYVG